MGMQNRSTLLRSQLMSVCLGSNEICTIFVPINTLEALHFNDSQEKNQKKTLI